MLGLGMSDSERFVRAHCPFINTYSHSQYSVYCKSGPGPDSEVVAGGDGPTKEAAWEKTEEQVKIRLAYLQNLGECISEIDNSQLFNKDTIAAFLREKFTEDGRGIR